MTLNSVLRSAQIAILAFLVGLLLRRLRRRRPKRNDTITDATTKGDVNASDARIGLNHSSSATGLSHSSSATGLNRFASRDYYSTNPMSVVKEPVVIAMVGLPARGKSYISKAMVRYLNFMGCPARLFNAGNKRRDKGLAGASDAFFDSENAEAKQLREQIAMDTLDELLTWLQSVPDGCACGIFDATNTTVERRRAVRERCAKESLGVRLIFLESICSDETILKNNYAMKLGNNDYKGTDSTEALQDFIKRVRAYEKVYEPITDEEGQYDVRSAKVTMPHNLKALMFRYVQIVNAGRKLVTAGCDGFVMSHLTPLFHCINLTPRKVSIVLAGESQDDRKGLRGGDSCLSAAGLQYSKAVCRLIKQRESLGKSAQVWTGTLRRYSQLVDLLRDPSRLVMKVKVLDEICFGELEGLACGRLRHSYPKEHAKREEDKTHYRYPGAGGESYMDMIMRLRECVLAMERVRSDAIVVCDMAVARGLLGYFQGTPIEEIPDLEICPGIIELTRSHSGFEVLSVPVEEGDVSFLARPVPPSRAN